MICTILSTGQELNSPNLNEEDFPFLRMKNELQALLIGLYSQGYTEFYVNCEYGLPLWAAEDVVAMKKDCDIRLHIVMPYEEQAVRWPEALRERYFRLHEQADSVTMVNACYHPDCYKAADRLMIEASDLLVVCGEKGTMSDAESQAEAIATEIFDASFVMG